MLFVRRRAWMKMGDIGSNGKINTKLAPVHRIVVVLSDSFAYFTGGYADNWIVIAVVVRKATKKLTAENAFFEILFLPVEGFLDDMAEEGGVSLALHEEGTG
jgi:hypothetical protein